MSKELKFPEGFIWGTSTAAYQIESASDHDWKGLKCSDGSTFDKCSMHDTHRDEDLEYICQLAPGYRISLDWAKLQKAPFAEFDPAMVAEYTDFLQRLKDRNIHIMLVLHHFTNPMWFVNKGGWEKEENAEMFLDYVQKMIDTFGHFADTWNTFNEPAVYVSNGMIMGMFPPFKKNIFKAFKVINILGRTHEKAYDMIKAKFPNAPVGISKNTVKFVGEIFPGHIFAKIFDWWFMDYCADRFTKTDFQGMSYYARMPFRPFPIDEMSQPGKLAKLGRRHDMMWEYKPEEFYHIIHRYWKKYKKPIIITENGVCTDDPKFRKESIKEYLTWIHKAIEDGVDIRGYFHWSTIDNHEWNIGLKYRFGLVTVNFDTFERTMTEAGLYYADITHNNRLLV